MASEKASPDVQRQSDSLPSTILGQHLSFRNSDHDLWWKALAPQFEAHLHAAEMKPENVYKHLLLLHDAFLPAVGPFPNPSRSNVTWKSGLPGGGEPWEFSLNYRQSKRPQFRFCIEPIGHFAGTASDQMNQNAARELLSRLKSLNPDIHVELFDHFSRQVALSNDQASELPHALETRQKFQHSIAIDFDESKFKVKAYFAPKLRSLATGESHVRIMVDSTRMFFKNDVLNPGLAHVDDFLSTCDIQLFPDTTFFGIDCDEPSKSRIKYYTGANLKSIEEAQRFWTLDGRLHGEELDRGFDLVKTVWDFLFHQPTRAGEVRHSLNLIWNWELRPSDPNVAPKAYFFLAEESDQTVLAALEALFKKLGWAEHMATQTKVDKISYPEHDFVASCSLYYWIAVAFSQQSGPYVTVYSNPAAIL